MEYTTQSYFYSDGKAIYRRLSVEDGRQTAYIQKGGQAFKINNQ